jgi:hypothetical protein
MTFQMFPWKKETVEQNTCYTVCPSYDLAYLDEEEFGEEVR